MGTFLNSAIRFADDSCATVCSPTQLSVLLFCICPNTKPSAADIIDKAPVTILSIIGLSVANKHENISKNDKNIAQNAMRVGACSLSPINATTQLPDSTFFLKPLQNTFSGYPYIFQ